MDLCGHVVDCLNESLVPLGYVTGEVTGSRYGTSLAVEELTWDTRPVANTSGSELNKVLKDLAIDLKSNLLRENLSKLDLGVKVVVSVKILS